MWNDFNNLAETGRFNIYMHTLAQLNTHFYGCELDSVNWPQLAIRTNRPTFSLTTLCIV